MLIFKGVLYRKITHTTAATALFVTMAAKKRLPMDPRAAKVQRRSMFFTEEKIWEVGVHHKNLVTWENRAPKDWQVASPLVMWDFSYFF